MGINWIPRGQLEPPRYEGPAGEASVLYHGVRHTRPLDTRRDLRRAGKAVNPDGIPHQQG